MQCAGRREIESTVGVVRVLAPLPHGRAHGQNLVFKFRAGLASQQVQLQGDVIRQAQCAVFPGDDQRRGFSAGAP